ncbi:MAG: LemA family protein [Kiloniellales bacterium]|nr:LemA family protein [Kiloniellales bacterium]
MAWRHASRLLAVLLLGLSLSACGVNELPTRDEAAKAAWAEVENQYKRRADLIPNLVETVKGFAGQERDVLTAVVEARAKVAQMTIPKDIIENPEAFRKFEANQGALSQALARLLVVVERYPTLTSNQNFLALQSSLEGSENRIAVARRDYIQAVQAFNTELRTFPGRIWAAILYSDLKLKETFSAPEGSSEPPEVSFQ